MPAEPLELELPEGADVARALSGRLRARVGPPRVEERVLEDTFDGRLRAAGLVDGVAREEDRLAAAGLRALLPLAALQVRVRQISVLNEDEKTVVRVDLEEPRLAGGPSLTRRVRIRPVRGYERDFERVRRALTSELGLLETERTLFDEAVTAAGHSPEGISSKPRVELECGQRADVAAGLVLARLADIAKANVEGTLADLDTEFLHDLRVSVRRARSVLRELEGVHPPADWRHVRDELKWVQQVSGPARDLDVQLLEWDELTGALPEHREADLAPLRALLERRRETALRDLRRALRSRRFPRALNAWQALAATPPAAEGDPDRPRANLPIEAVAADRIHRVYRKMVAEGSSIGEESPDEDLHDLRKRGKELRYLLELFGGLFPGAVVKPMVSSLKELQDVLGRFQDRAVQAELMRELGTELVASEGGPGALMALGYVIDALERDQGAARGEFGERFAAFAAKSQRRLVRETFPKL